MTPQTQRDLNAETDARFAAQTGVTRKLDPQNPIDRPLIPVWTDIHARVRREWDQGRIAWTFNHPIVVGALDAARAHATMAAAYHDAAAQASSADAARAHLADAQVQHAAAAHQARVAAAVQPPSVYPPLLRTAAHHVLHFVMNGNVGQFTGETDDAGRAIPPVDVPGAMGPMGPMGPPPVLGGADAVTAVQATSAPGSGDPESVPAPAPAPASALATNGQAGDGDHTILYVAGGLVVLGGAFALLHASDRRDARKRSAA